MNETAEGRGGARPYLYTWLALLLLTGLTLLLSFPDLGGLESPVAIAIATMKAALVGLFFMHLWTESASSRLALLLALLLVAILIGLILTDVGPRARASVAPAGRGAAESGGQAAADRAPHHVHEPVQLLEGRVHAG